MNRLTNPFSSVVPQQSTDAIPIRATTPSTDPRSHDYTLRPSKSHEPKYTIIYDDPRQTHYAESSTTAARRADALARDARDTRDSRDIRDTDGRKGKARFNFGRGEGKRGWGVSTIQGSGRISSMAHGENRRYAVGGGQYLRVLHVRAGRDHHPERIDEVVNLWKPSYLVDKSVTDLDWGAHESSHKLFSATPSGNFLIFDVPKGRLDREIRGGHSRPINVVRACKTQGHGSIVITGGTEGQARIFDIRAKDPSTRKHYKHSGGITSLTFAPDSPHQFLVGLDNGSIQRYDMRNQAKATGRVWGAHGNKAVMDLKWKDGVGGWLASAGEDRTVQIWDMSQQWDRPPTPIHILHTPHPVRRVAWRPEHPTELVVIPNPSPLSSINPSIASIPQGLESFQAAENHLEIWDVRRHYVPKYAVPIVDGTPIDLDWWDDSRLVGAFPGCFTELDIGPKEERVLPLEHIPRQVMGWNGRGEMVYAVDRFMPGEIPFDDPKPDLSNHWDRIGKHPKSVQDAAYEPVQALGMVQMPDVDEEDFEFLATHYRLEGGPRLQLCQWNRSVAEHCGRHDDARIWAFLEVLIDEFSHAQTIDPFSAPPVQSTRPPSPTMSPRQTVPDAGRSPSPIALERIDDSLGDVEELLGSSASTTSSTEGRGQRSPRSRFQAFTPYTNKQLAEITATTTSATGTLSKHSSLNVKSPPMVSSGKGTPRPLLAQALGKSETGRRLSMQNQTEAEELDYPDPYGVLPFADMGKMNESSFLGRASSSSGSTARGSLGASKILNASPEPTSSAGVPKTTHPIHSTHPSHSNSAGSGNTGVQGRGSNKTTPLMSLRPSPTSAPVRVDSPMKRVQLPAPSLPESPPGDHPWAGRSREDKYGKEAWAAYKRQRAGPLVAWWSAYVEDGEVQLASTMLVVGRGVVDFPEAQSERIVHAYLELLEANRLSVQSAYIKKYAFIPSLDVRPADDGVTHVVHCAQCGRSTGSVEIGPDEGTFWWCKRCKRNARQCVICHEPVKGLSLGCRRCSHGGHQRCMRLHYLESEPRDLSTHRRTSTDKSRTSGETYRTESAKHSDEAQMIKWNPCASGCGCKCRVVIGFAEVGSPEG